MKLLQCVHEALFDVGKRREHDQRDVGDLGCGPPYRIAGLVNRKIDWAAISHLVCDPPSEGLFNSHDLPGYSPCSQRSCREVSVLQTDRAAYAGGRLPAVEIRGGDHD